MPIASRISRLVSTLVLPVCAVSFSAASGGCSGTPAVDDRFPVHTLYNAEFGRARHHVAAHLSDNTKDRRYLLDRARLGMYTLADGYGESAVHVFTDVYDAIRTQGVNEGKEVVAIAINEDLKLWKGEPFEQAIALAYTAMAHAQVGSWDNTRAASRNALFYLRDFGYDQQTKERLNQLALAQRAAAHDRGDPDGIDLDHGYAVAESNFALAYLLHGVASQQLDRPDEADDYFRRALQFAPHAEDTINAFADGDYNAVLVVSHGLGPRKVGIGPAEAVAAFRPRTSSDGSALSVQLNDGPAQRVHWLTDVNEMAADHLWNNLEDVRKAKAAIGDTLLALGAGTGLYAITRGDEGSTRDAAAAVAVGLLLTGAILREGAHADLRFNDAIAQRYYAVPLKLPVDSLDATPHAKPLTVTLQVDGRPASRLVLRGLETPDDRPGKTAVFRYVRLPARPGDIPLPWATNDAVFLGNPVTGAASEHPLPILFEFGNDARPPTDAALRDYQDAGSLLGTTLADLRELYRQRNYTWELEDTRGVAGLHVLEGGDSLVAPMGGTTGFQRLYGNPRYLQQTQPNDSLVGAEQRPGDNSARRIQ